MELTHISSRGFDIFVLKGKLTVSSLPPLTSRLSRHVQEHPDRDVALEVSGVDTIDSSGLRLVVNLRKRLESHHASLYIAAPSDPVRQLLEQTNLTAVLPVIDAVEQIERRKATDVFQACRELAVERDGWLSLTCSCPVCGSPHVSAYLIDTGAYRWRWDEPGPFPTAYAPGSDRPVEVFGHLPVVCQDCYLASIDVSAFNVLSGKSVARRSIMDDSAKSLLAKSMKKRKKMMEIGVAVGERFFEHPRDERACYQACLLAATCSRTLALDRKHANPFSIGYLNYLAWRFAKGSAADEHVSNCRTWLNQALGNPHSLTPTEAAVAHFVMFVADLDIGKKKEAAHVYSAFAELLDNQPAGGADDSIASPRFWFSQTERVWRREIKDKSREIQLHG